MTNRFLVACAALLLLGGGCTTGITRANGFITYSLPTDERMEVVESSLPAIQLFTTRGLQSMAAECGTAKDSVYYDELINKLSGIAAERYEFTYTGDVQTPNWIVTAMPNVFGYADIAAFREDFDICSAGAGLYPSQVTTNTLLFISSCGSGYDDGSGREHGCPLLREAIEPTIVLD